MQIRRRCVLRKDGFRQEFMRAPPESRDYRKYSNFLTRVTTLWSASSPNLEYQVVPVRHSDGLMTVGILRRCTGYTSYFQSDGELSSAYDCRDGGTVRPKAISAPRATLCNDFINQPLRSQDGRTLLATFTHHLRLSRVAHDLISCALTANTITLGGHIIYHKKRTCGCIQTGTPCECPSFSMLSIFYAHL